jgi:hypothetical protein
VEKKQQMIETFTSKRARLLRDRALAAMVAAEAKTSREALIVKTGARLAAVERSLDSVTAARERISRENVLHEKEYGEKSRGILKQMDSMSTLISRTAREGTNLKAQLDKQRKDSVDAVYRRDSASLAYGIKLGPFVEALTKKTVGYETLSRKRDAMEKRLQERDAAAKKDLSAAADALAAALAAKNSTLAEYDAVAARQQKAREDSAAVTAAIRDSAKAAQVSMEAQKEELAARQERHDQILTRIRQARTDSANAVLEKKQQRVTFQKILAELNYKIFEGEQAQKKLEAQRAALEKRTAGKGK